MPQVFSTFLFKLILTVVISVLIGFQIAKIKFKEAEYSFRKILANQPEMAIDNKLQSEVGSYLSGKQSLPTGKQSLPTGKEGEYSVYVKDLKLEGKRNVCIRCEETFEAASLYKLFLMAAVYQAVYDGKLTLDTQIQAKMSHLKAVYGGVDFGYESFSDEEVIAYTVGESLERIATISDNFAALMLAEKIGWGSIQDIADETGEGKTSILNPITTSSKDVGLFLEKLYNGEIVSLESSEQILDMLSKSKLNNRIPAKLPEEIKIAHKTGELPGVRNDAGVVFLDPSAGGPARPAGGPARPAGGPYVIVLMSKNLKGEDEGVENLAEISRIVYEYYSTN